MTEKRFVQGSDEQGYWRIEDTETGKTSQKYDDIACTWLNELNEETQQLTEIKEILNNLNSMDCYWDSALLTEVIENIANVIGVDLDE